VDYYHRLRPHQGKDNELLVTARRRKRKPPPTDVIPLTEVRCERQLGGLLTHDYRKAA